VTSRGARRAVNAHRAATAERQTTEAIGVISLSNYTEVAAAQRRRAKQRAEKDRRAGVVVLTSLTEEQLAEDRRDEALMWPARWW
jgi:hypothetical protein